MVAELTERVSKLFKKIYGEKNTTIENKIALMNPSHKKRNKTNISNYIKFYSFTHFHYIV